MVWRLLAVLGLLTGSVVAVSCSPSSFLALAPKIVGNDSNKDGDPFTETRDVDTLRTEMIDAINSERADRNLPLLVASPSLHGIAQAHSTDMVTNNFLTHTGSDKSTPQDRVKRALGDWSYLSENIAAGYSTIQRAVDAFMASQDNRNNLLAKEPTQIGVGIAFSDDTPQYKNAAYITVLFYAPR